MASLSMKHRQNPGIAARSVHSEPNPPGARLIRRVDQPPDPADGFRPNPARESAKGPTFGEQGYRCQPALPAMYRGGVAPAKSASATGPHRCAKSRSPVQPFRRGSIGKAVGRGRPGRMPYSICPGSVRCGQRTSRIRASMALRLGAAARAPSVSVAIAPAAMAKSSASAGVAPSAHRVR